MFREKSARVGETQMTPNPVTRNSQNFTFLAKSSQWCSGITFWQLKTTEIMHDLGKKCSRRRHTGDPEPSHQKFPEFYISLAEVPAKFGDQFLTAKNYWNNACFGKTVRKNEKSEEKMGKIAKIKKQVRNGYGWASATFQPFLRFKKSTETVPKMAILI